MPESDWRAITNPPELSDCAWQHVPSGAVIYHLYADNLSSAWVLVFRERIIFYSMGEFMAFSDAEALIEKAMEKI